MAKKIKKEEGDAEASSPTAPSVDEITTLYDLLVSSNLVQRIV